MNITLKIVDDDGDSFAQRAEMYYRKRPELINFIEDSFRAYRALAERYDSLSRELQSANRTIATVFPERVQYAMADEDDQDQNSSETSTSGDHPNKPTKISPADSKSSIPKVPKIPKKDFRSPSRMMSRKGYEPLRRMASSAKADAVPISGLNKTEALEEIDKLQKGILALQTEKEFVKCMYEHGYQKYWDIENQITEMQKKVSGLQDEFGIGMVIEDNEARKLMAATALKSCHETLVKLQKKQGQSEEETVVENQRISKGHQKFETIKNEFLSKHELTEEFKSLDGNNSSKAPEKHDRKMLRKKIMERLEVNSSSHFNVTELAEKIDELVNKVVTLETSVASQSSLVQRLRSETNELHAHIRSLEEDKETLMESSEHMSKKLKELEEELRRVKILNCNVQDENNNLQMHFAEASCNLDHLSDKLQTVKQDEEVNEHRRLFQKVKAVPDDHAKPEMESGEEDKSKLVTSDDDYSVSRDVVEKEEEEKKEEKTHEPIHHHQEEGKEDLSEMADSDVDGKQQELEAEKEENQPHWRQMFLKGLEDREKILLEEYTSVLQDYKEVRKKLSEVENKNRDSIFELAMQVRDLKHHIASKDEEIKCLQHKSNFQQSSSNPDESPSACSTEYKYANLEPQSGILLLNQSAHSPYHHGSPSLNSDESIYEAGEHEKFTSSSLLKDQKTFKKKRVPMSHTVSTIEERLRSNIDEQLEENLEFWLRFSTSVHQIHKFQTSIDDLQSDLSLLMNKKKQGGANSKQHPLQSDARPIYRHLREIKTELSLWLEHNAVLKYELEDRFSSLCNIGDEISRISNASSKLEKTELRDYQAAKFQGEVRNMKQENKKVVEELQVGLNRVKALKVQVEKTLSKMDEELGISPLKNSHPTMKQAANRVRIPLRSFLFGVKLKRQKPSIFSCVSPALHKQHSDLPASAIPPS